uniref:Pentatricopeptide repeat protein n=1 Tax=Helianthus annuus TaxID=4232 RepID=A0A251TRC4_HELAN
MIQFVLPNCLILISNSSYDLGIQTTVSCHCLVESKKLWLVSITCLKFFPVLLSHGGLLNKGLTLFKSMRESQRVEIRHEHYACVIDILLSVWKD